MKVHDLSKGFSFNTLSVTYTALILDKTGCPFEKSDFFIFLNTLRKEKLVGVASRTLKGDQAELKDNHKI